jgi:hypothetical protein
VTGDAVHLSLDDILLGATVIEVRELTDEEDVIWTVLVLDNGFELHTSGDVSIARPLLN